jgi:hypothetical protein
LTLTLTVNKICAKKNFDEKYFWWDLENFSVGVAKTFLVDIDVLRKKNFGLENFWDLEYFSGGRGQKNWTLNHFEPK